MIIDAYASVVLEVETKTINIVGLNKDKEVLYEVSSKRCRQRGFDIDRLGIFDLRQNDPELFEEIRKWCPEPNEELKKAISQELIFQFGLLAATIILRDLTNG